jgi:hypothetical protein
VYGWKDGIEGPAVNSTAAYEVCNGSMVMNQEIASKREALYARTSALDGPGRLFRALDSHRTRRDSPREELGSTTVRVDALAVHRHETLWVVPVTVLL